MEFIDKDLWTNAAQRIEWIQPPSTVLGSRRGTNPHIWFPGGTLNTCYNCLDRHVKTDPHRPAFIWDSPVSNSKRTYTYEQVLEQVQTLAGLLWDHKVRKGDVVLIYMPMVPEAAFALLACARLGAIHSVVFGGFAPKELAKRISDCKPKVILTASCGIEPKRTIAYRPLLKAALAMTMHTVPVTLVLQRPMLYATMEPNDLDFATEMERVRQSNLLFKDCVEVASEDPLYILYTSGTTGQPKGVVRSNGGHAVVINWSVEYVFGIKKGDVMFTASDIGWAVSHSYTVYGPLFVGATSILYEGKPVLTPDAGQFWRVVSEYGVKTMFTAPTAVRAIRREDPAGLLAKQYDMRSLKALFLAGERSDPETLRWCQDIVGSSCLVIDNYWSTELGSPVTATCMGDVNQSMKLGSAGRQVPGSLIRVILEDSHQEATGPNQFGNIVLKLPLPPASFPCLWNNPEGYNKSYFAKYPGYYDTGDAGMIDEEGFVHIMSRVDDIINVAGHRLSTGSIEEILIAHPKVAECCVVPLPDEIKGHVPLGILVLKTDDDIVFEELLEELVANTRRDLGAIACFNRAVIVPKLPKTRSGKVLRRCIRDMLEGKPLKVPATIEDETALQEIQDILEAQELLPKKMSLAKL